MKTVLITGSSRGLGKELAIQFAKEGYNIILNDKDVERLKIVEEYLQGFFGKIKMVSGDLRLETTREKLCAVATEMDIEILINNAGVLTSGTFREMDIKKIRAMLEINLAVPIDLTKKIYPIFLKKQSGLIININSIAGKNPNDMEAVYCASKYGLRGFFDSFKFEAMKHNVHIMNIYSGAMNTTMAEGKADRDKLIDPTEVAKAIFNLCKNYDTLKISEINLWRKNY